MLGLRLVVGNVVLPLQPGGGDALTRGLNEVRRKLTMEHYEIYSNTIAEWLS